jgi:hypothetical protein
MDRPTRNNSDSTNLFPTERNDIPTRQYAGDDDSFHEARMGRPVRQVRTQDVDCACTSDRGGINISNSTVYIYNGDRPRIAGRYPAGYAPYADDQMSQYGQDLRYQQTIQALDYSRAKLDHSYEVAERMRYERPYAGGPFDDQYMGRRRMMPVSANDYDYAYDNRNGIQRGFDEFGRTVGSIARALLPVVAVGAEVSMLNGMSHGGFGRQWGGNNFFPFAALGSMGPLAYRSPVYQQPYYNRFQQPRYVNYEPNYSYDYDDDYSRFS